jgi:hypothetical protein
LRDIPPLNDAFRKNTERNRFTGRQRKRRACARGEPTTWRFSRYLTPLMMCAKDGTASLDIDQGHGNRLTFYSPVQNKTYSSDETIQNARKRFIKNH